MRAVAIAAVVAVLALGACSDDGPGDLPAATVSTTTTEAPVTVTSSTVAPATTIAGEGDEGATSTVPTTAAPADPVRRALDDIDIGLVEVATFDVPVAVQVHPVSRELFVAEKGGVVRRLADRGTVLDLRGRVSSGNEQGLLGIAISPGGDLLYVSFTAVDGTSIIEEYALVDGVADPLTRRELLLVGQPFGNHNGGDIHIGPDGYLWIGLGDGGSAGDPEGNGQDAATLLGSILRIDPTTPGGGRAYGIPADNPFVDGGGAPEAWLTGVRNPWRFSFDPATDDLWVGDVGQNQWEEITLLPAPTQGRGANLGWNIFEGTHRFTEVETTATITGPVYEYDHGGGNCSITGGSVYRGPAIPALDGAYFFADYCRDGIRAIRATIGDDGRPVATEHRVWELGSGNVVSFGVDAAGELLVLTKTGVVHRIVEL